MSTFSPTNGARRGPRGIPVSPMSYQGIEEVARQVRAVFKVAPRDPLPALDIFERLSSFRVGNIPCEYGIRKLGSLVLGQTSYDPEAKRLCIDLDEETYEQLLQDGVRARFSFAHEVGHLALHYEEVIQLSMMPHTANVLARTPTHEHFRDSEWQADAFGAALLMPAEALKEMAAQGALTIDQVMRQFRVSNPAASNRIHTLRRYRAVP